MPREVHGISAIYLTIVDVSSKIPHQESGLVAIDLGWMRTIPMLCDTWELWGGIVT